MTAPLVLVQTEGALIVITINRPEARNASGKLLKREMRRLLLGI